MMAVIFLASSLLFGLAITQRARLTDFFSPVETLWMAVVLGIIGSSWITFGLSTALDPQIGLIVSILCLLALSLWSLRATPLSQIAKHSFFPWKSRAASLSYMIYGFFWMVILEPLFVSRMLQVRESGLFSGGGSWGDLALHSTFIMMFSGQTTLSLQSPIYAQELTHYPFLIDYFSSLLVRGGWSVTWSLLIPGLLLATALFHLMYFLAWRFTRSSLASWTTSLLFGFNGGLGWWIFLTTWWSSNHTLWEALNSLTKDFTLYPEQGLQWSNIITTYLLPQRGMLMGLCVVTVFLLLLHAAWHHRAQTAARQNLLLLAAAMLGSLPLFHLHSFLFLLGLWIGLAGWSVVTGRSRWTEWLLPSVILVCLAMPQLSWQLASSISHEYPKLLWGWVKKKDEVVTSFWWWNMGPMFILSLLTTGWLSQQGKSASLLKILWVLATVAFLLANTLMLQPHHWDNMKLMLPSYLIFCLGVSWMLSQWWQHRTGKVLVLIVVFFSILSGGLSVIKENSGSWQIASQADIELAAQVRELTPPQSIFLTADDHNHPIPMLAGRPVVMGYRGWLWTHGIDYTQTERDITAIYTGQPSALGLLAKYHVAYVAVGRPEKAEYDVNELFFATHFPVLLETNGEKIYHITTR